MAAAPAVTSAYYSLGSLAMTKMATLAAGGGVAGKIYQILNTADSVVDMGEMIYGLAICKDNPVLQNVWKFRLDYLTRLYITV